MLREFNKVAHKLHTYLIFSVTQSGQKHKLYLYRLFELSSHTYPNI